MKGEWPEKVYVYSEGDYHTVYSTPGPPKALRTSEIKERKRRHQNFDDVKVFECEVVKVGEL
jgi:hypothetical protein